MRNVSCPSCGAPFRFRGATSVVGICGYCKATLVRKDADLENIGKQAELLEDDSPIQMGASGRHRNQQFTVVGRIQYRYGAGSWNEWHVLFPDGKSAWLSDASRIYTITYLSPPVIVPEYTDLRPGHRVMVGKEAYTVTNIEQAEVIAGEGELPFKFEAGWKADVVDLRGDGARFATIDYSEQVPHVYVGERLPFDVFGFTGLRDPDRVGFTKGRALTFKCGGCGAPIEKQLATTETIACTSCGTVTDVTTDVARTVQKNERNEKFVNPSIPLGSTGQWAGAKYEVVGFMRRGITVDGVLYTWGEYLLHNVAQGYAWISEYAGHFSFIRDAAELPKSAKGLNISGRRPDMTYLGRRFKHFQSAAAEVTQLMGEFYWKVKLKDTALVDDYVAPPLILSSERSGNDFTWSLGEYAEAPALWKAFNLPNKPPMQSGVAPNQPSPHEGKVARYWLLFFAAVVIAFLLKLVIGTMQSGGKPVQVDFTVPAAANMRQVSPVFELAGGAGQPLVIRTNSNLTTHWLGIDMQLTNADSGRAWALSREIGFKSLAGTLIGDNHDIAEIRGVPPGRYTLGVVVMGNQNWGGEVPLRMDLSREPAGWSNFWLMTFFLSLFPLIAWGRSRSFETKRWSESDYAPDEEE